MANYNIREGRDRTGAKIKVRSSFPLEGIGNANDTPWETSDKYTSVPFALQYGIAINNLHLLCAKIAPPIPVAVLTVWSPFLLIRIFFARGVLYRSQREIPS